MNAVSLIGNGTCRKHVYFSGVKKQTLGFVHLYLHKSIKYTDLNFEKVVYLLFK